MILSRHLSWNFKICIKIIQFGINMYFPYYVVTYVTSSAHVNMDDNHLANHSPAITTNGTGHMVSYIVLRDIMAVWEGFYM